MGFKLEITRLIIRSLDSVFTSKTFFSCYDARFGFLKLQSKLQRCQNPGILPHIRSYLQCNSHNTRDEWFFLSEYFFFYG